MMRSPRRMSRSPARAQQATRAQSSKERKPVAITKAAKASPSLKKSTKTSPGVVKKGTKASKPVVETTRRNTKVTIAKKLSDVTSSKQKPSPKTLAVKKKTLAHVPKSKALSNTKAVPSPSRRKNPTASNVRSRSTDVAKDENADVSDVAESEDNEITFKTSNVASNKKSRGSRRKSPASRTSKTVDKEDEDEDDESNGIEDKDTESLQGRSRSSSRKTTVNSRPVIPSSATRSESIKSPIQGRKAKPKEDESRQGKDNTQSRENSNTQTRSTRSESLKSPSRGRKTKPKEDLSDKEKSNSNSNCNAQSRTRSESIKSPIQSRKAKLKDDESSEDRGSKQVKVNSGQIAKTRQESSQSPSQGRKTKSKGNESNAEKNTKPSQTQKKPLNASTSSSQQTVQSTRKKVEKSTTESKVNNSSHEERRSSRNVGTPQQDKAKRLTSDTKDSSKTIESNAKTVVKPQTKKSEKKTSPTETIVKSSDESEDEEKASKKSESVVELRGSSEDSESEVQEISSEEEDCDIFKTVQKKLLALKSQHKAEMKKKDEEMQRLKNELSWKEEQLSEMNSLMITNMELESKISAILSDKKVYESEVQKLNESQATSLVASKPDKQDKEDKEKKVSSPKKRKEDKEDKEKKVTSPKKKQEKTDVKSGDDKVTEQEENKEKETANEDNEDNLKGKKQEKEARKSKRKASPRGEKVETREEEAEENEPVSRRSKRNRKESESASQDDSKQGKNSKKDKAAKKKKGNSEEPSESEEESEKEKTPRARKRRSSGEKKTKGKKRRKSKRSKKVDSSDEEDIDALFVSDKEEEEESDDLQIIDDPDKSEKKDDKEDEKKEDKDVTSPKKDSEKEDADKQDDDDEHYDKGRHNIRKLMTGKKLTEETKAAAKAEKDRRERAEKEHEKHLVEKQIDPKTKIEICTRLVLAFKEGTKKPLVEVMPKLLKKLKPHQVEAIEFMWDNLIESLDKLSDNNPGEGCILAHCMGLGKTLSVISLVHTLMTSKAVGMKTCLVVCPLNTVLNWQYEWHKWLDKKDRLPTFELASCRDNISRAELLTKWHTSGGVMIIGYALFRILASYTGKSKKCKSAFDECLLDPGPDIVICDEGHILKNDASALSKWMTKIRSQRRVVLTGTPLQNNLIEYHCMAKFVKPKLLGTRREFMNRFVNPITNGQHSDSTPRDVKLMKRRAHVLHEMLDGCVQRRDYSALTKFLPPKNEYVISVRLSPLQIQLYRKYLETFRPEENEAASHHQRFKIQGASLFTDYQALMRVWTHPWVLKLDAVRQERKAFLLQDDELDSIDTDGLVSDDSEEEEVEMLDLTKDEEESDEALVIDTSDGSSVDTSKARPTRAQRSQAAKETEDADKKDGSDKKRKAKRLGKKWDKKIKMNGNGQKGDDASTSISDTEESMASDAEKTKVLGGEVIRAWKTTSRHGKQDAVDQDDLVRKDTRWWSELIDEEKHKTMVELSGKLVLLFEILRMADGLGDKVLVFSQSLLSLDLIEEFLKCKDEEAQKAKVKKGEKKPSRWVKDEDYYRMDGSTGVQNRRKFTSSFNTGDSDRMRLFLISTRAGGLGINLDSANRVIIFDASWNPSHDIQSIFRVYRFGQEKDVYVYRFVAQGTMEEKIYDRQITKETLSQRVIDEHQIDRHFTANDLQELYIFKPDDLTDPNRTPPPVPQIPKDLILAELLSSQSEWIYGYHEHDSLLENRPEENLTEEERKAAWDDYEREKQGLINYNPQPRPYVVPQQMIPNLIAPVGGTATAQLSNLLSSITPYSQPQINMQIQQLPRVVKEILKYNPNITASELQIRLQSFLGMHSSITLPQSTAPTQPSGPVTVSSLLQQQRNQQIQQQQIQQQQQSSMPSPAQNSTAQNSTASAAYSAASQRGLVTTQGLPAQGHLPPRPYFPASSMHNHPATSSSMHNQPATSSSMANHPSTSSSRMPMTLFPQNIAPQQMQQLPSRLPTTGYVPALSRPMPPQQTVVAAPKPPTQPTASTSSTSQS